MCDGAGWLNSITLPIDDSYHPTATGQKDGYLPVFSAAAASAWSVKGHRAEEEVTVNCLISIAGLVSASASKVGIQPGPLTEPHRPP